MNTEQMISQRVLVVRLPESRSAEYLITLRGYIVESLEAGVLVLSEGVTWEVAELPELGGVRVLQGGGVQEKAADSVQAVVQTLPKEDLKGRNREEKRAILERMSAYRAANGLGCWKAVAAKTRHAVSEDLLRDLYLGKAVQPIKVWRKIGAALDKLEGERPQ